MMLTGAFAIDNEYNVNCISYYQKCFCRIGIHALVFSGLYFFQNDLCSVYKGQDIVTAISAYVWAWLRGWPGHPLWYLYTLMGIYMLIPLVASLRRRYGNSKLYHVMAVGYCAWAFLSLYFESTTVSWSISKVFGFLGFVVLGNELRHFLEGKGNNVISISLGIGGFLLYQLEYLILHKMVIGGGEYYIPYLNSHVAPISLMGASLIFSGITMLRIRIRLSLTVKYSPYVYLMHRMVLDFTSFLFVDNEWDYNVCILVMTLSTLGLSFLCAVIYERLYARVLRLFGNNG